MHTGILKQIHPLKVALNISEDEYLKLAKELTGKEKEFTKADLVKIRNELNKRYLEKRNGNT